MRRLKSILSVLAILKIVSLVLMIFKPIAPPHNWRQVDTVGVAMRYWLRWTVEGDKFPTMLYPAVLQSGDGKGISGQEFPILNLFLAPAFAAGDYWGVIGVHLLLLLLTFALFKLNFCLWKNKTILDIPASLVILTIPFFSFFVPYWGRVIPDIIAGLLAFGAVGALWPPLKLRSKSFWLGVCLMSLAILIKPVAIAGIFLLGLSTDLKKHLHVMVFSLLTSLILPGFYYTLGLKHLNSFRDGPEIFVTSGKLFLAGWMSVLNDIPGLLQMLFSEAFNYGGLAIILLIAIFFKKDRPLLGKAFSVFLVSLFAIFTLAGSHVYVHSYYLAPIAPSCAVIFLLCWNITAQLEGLRRKYAQIFLAIALLGSTLNYIPMDLLGWYYKGRPGDLFQQCRQLKQQAKDWPWKQGLSFRSTEEPYPLLGLCFGEREGSKIREKGFFYKNHPLPSDCKAEFESEHLVLANCKQTTQNP